MQCCIETVLCSEYATVSPHVTRYEVFELHNCGPDLENLRTNFPAFTHPRLRLSEGERAVGVLVRVGTSLVALAWWGHQDKRSRKAGLRE